MSIRFFSSYRLWILCAVLTASAAAQEHTGTPAESVRITTSKQSSSVRSITRLGERYIAVKEIGEVLGVRYFENTVLQKAEIRLDRAVLKFTVDNAFVIQTDPATNRNSVIQFSHPILFEQGLFFAPSGEILPLLRTLADQRIAFDADTAAPAPAVAAKPVIQGFTVVEKKNGTLLRIHATAPVTDASKSLQVGQWVYVTLPAASGDTLALDTTFATGLIRRIKPVQMESAFQLSLQIRGTVAASEIANDQTGNDILLSLIPPQPEPAPAVNADSVKRVQEMERLRKQTAQQIKNQKKKWKLDVVVIDPGHGGHDPGALGVIGTREKDITLGIGLKLGSLISKYMPGVKTVYTRNTDRFVELFKRGQIANEAGGKLFISIHCNSTERKPSSASGFEIYLLRPGKTEDAIRIAEKENEVVKLEKNYEARYQQLNEENFIILTMAQSSYVKQSERFAELLEETMSQDMEGKRESVKQAGFYVLVGASMPNVLVEAGYLSNPKEEKFLRSPAGQQKIAEAILKALQRYKVEYEEDIN